MIWTRDLPWPPSNNHYYTVVRGRKILSAEGRRYKETVALMCSGKFGPDKPLAGRLSLEILAYPPDRRVRDLSNIIKSLEDALTYARVWQDDGQIDRIVIDRAAVMGPLGSITVTVSQL